MKDNKSLGIIPYWNLKHDENMKEYYDYYKPIINSYLQQFNREIFERNYDEAESCRFEFKYILTVNGLDKLLVFCENTFKCTWKVILETYNVKKNTTTFTETEFYILEELSSEDYIQDIIRRYKDYLFK